MRLQEPREEKEREPQRPAAKNTQQQSHVTHQSTGNISTKSNLVIRASNTGSIRTSGNVFVSRSSTGSIRAGGRA
jgi:hypothetical protein